jgi:hypothetical protein
MREIALFVEDHAHHLFLKALISRIANENDLRLELNWHNVRRGHGAVIRELKQYVHDLRRDRAGLPDLVIVATDANCKGMQERLKEILTATKGEPIAMICAIPDPHIERWLLLDSAAFKTVFGRGCKPPDHKCERARYKKLLVEAILETDITPSLGGIEFTEDIVRAMDFLQAGRRDPSLGQLLEELHAYIEKWKR